ncbi:MAG: hypothetical protein LBQ06_00375, partial [Frankiaceae bacterium]|nr:hypothetical protein [Frankiaceae bacterium]
MFWTDDEPWHGETSTLLAYSAELNRAVDSMSTGQTTLINQGAALPGAWSGAAADSCLTTTEDLAGRCGAFIGWVNDCAAAVDTHRSLLDSIIQRATTAQNDLQLAVDWRAGLQSRVNDLEQQNRGLVLTPHSSHADQQLPVRLAAARGGLNRAIGREADVRSTIAALAAERHAAERALLGAINLLSPLSVPERLLAGALGIPLRGLTSAELGIELGELLRRDPGKWGYLQQFLDATTQDVTAQQALWLDLGADGAAQLMQRLAAPPPGRDPQTSEA